MLPNNIMEVVAVTLSLGGNQTMEIMGATARTGQAAKPFMN